jgi:hypothetical protein
MRDTHVVEEDTRVTTQSEEFARVKRVDVDEYSLESSIDQSGRGERKPVVVCVGVQFDSTGLGADSSSDS